jgi:hypothetical protein
MESWTNAAIYSDRISAEVALGLLTAANLPCYIGSNEYVPGMGSSFAVRVPAGLRDAALAVLGQADISEQDLADLAMSQPSEELPDR